MGSVEKPNQDSEKLAYGGHAKPGLITCSCCNPINTRQKETGSNLIQWTGLDMFPFRLSDEICSMVLLSCYHFSRLFTHRVLLSSIPPLWSCVGGFECAVCGCYLASFHLMQPSLSVRSRGFKATPSFH